MVRIVRHAIRPDSRAPHSRGDGPPPWSPGSICSACSPLAWGWSAAPSSASIRSSGAPHSRGDGPLRGDSWHCWRLCAPHSRGDGPDIAHCFRDKTLCSPLAWGWSVPGTTYGQGRGCSPLAWGWSVSRWTDRRRNGCAPHSRGDGPRGHGAVAGGQVLPTRVGMVRTYSGATAGMAGAPHSRGDGPQPRGIGLGGTLCSPLAWGWSAHTVTAAQMTLCSPLAWGWSELTYDCRPNDSVLPTRVGMVRRAPTGDVLHARAPHSRGDGPSLTVNSASGGKVLPTRVGMVRMGIGELWFQCVLPTRVGMVRE